MQTPAPASAAAPRARWTKLAAIAAVVCMLLAARQLGILDQLAKPVKLAQALVDLGGWGYLGFLVAYTLLQPFGVPGTVFVVAASIIWPWPTAYALSMIGSLTASSTGFNYARFVARDWAAPRIPARFRKYNDALEKRPFLTIFWLRFVLWMNPFLNLYLGISKVRGFTHFWASAAGFLLPMFLISYFGQRMLDSWRHLSRGTWISIAIAAGFAILIWLGVRAWRARKPKPEPTS